MVISIRGPERGNPSKQYLRCLSRMRRNGCTNRTGFLYSEIEPSVLDRVREFQLSDIMRIRHGDDPLREIDAEIAKAKLEIEKLDRLVANLTEELEAEDDASFRKVIRDKAKARLAQRNEQQERLEDMEHSRNKVQLELNEGTRIGDEIAQMRAQWEQADQSTRYQMRSRVNAAMHEFIDFISFNGDTLLVTVIVMGGLRAYRFRSGEFLDSVDLVGQLGSRAEGKIDPGVFAANFVTADPIQERVKAIDKLRHSDS
jgi:hypothetical protein